MIYTLLSFLLNIDSADWDMVRKTLGNTITISASGGRPERHFTAAEFLALIQHASGAFQATSHNAGNFRCRQAGRKGDITFDLMELHYLPQPSGGETFALFRTFQFDMELQDNGQWLIVKSQTLFEKAGGNTALGELIAKGPIKRLPVAPGRNTGLIADYFQALTNGDGYKFASLWADKGVLLKPFSSTDPLSISESIPACPSEFLWSLQGTHDPDISLVPYEYAGHFSAAVFYCKDGKILRLEDYRAERY